MTIDATNYKHCPVCKHYWELNGSGRGWVKFNATTNPDAKRPAFYAPIAGVPDETCPDCKAKP